MLHAQRYLQGTRPEYVKLIEKVHTFTFEGIQRFYVEIVPKLNRNELALLGGNDRFFLLTSILDRKDAINPWLYERIREVEADPDGYLDLWARYHYKSTIITFAGSIEAIIRDPEVTIAIFAATNQIARPFLEQIKEELETNEQLKFLYPDVFWAEPKKEAGTWSKARGIVVKRKTIRKELTVEAYGLVEALPTARHFDILTYDDLVTQDLVDNEDVIKKVGLRWEMSDNLGSGATKTRKRHIGTRYSFNDTYADIIDTGTVKVRLHAATDDGTEHGTPVFISATDWETIKRTQRNTYPAQMLQNPLAGKNNTFLGEHLRPYYMRPRTLNVYIMGDPSMGKTKTAGRRSSDRTAIVVIGIDSNNNKYLLDGMCHRMKLSERWESLKRLYNRWKPREDDGTGAEGVMNINVGWERYGMQSDLEYFEEKMQEKTNPAFKIEELSWTREGDQSKKARVQRLEPDFRENKFYVPAKVWRPSVAWADKENAEIKSGARVCLWGVDDAGAVAYRPIPLDPARGNLLMLTKEERSALASGEGFRLIEPIKRRDEEDRPYDVTTIFFNEYLRFPFGAHDDLIDAMSRIHDMKPTPAEILEKDALEPTVYEYERLA